jgi:hypothetical protein
MDDSRAKAAREACAFLGKTAVTFGPVDSKTVARRAAVQGEGLTGAKPKMVDGKPAPSSPKATDGATKESLYSSLPREAAEKWVPPAAPETKAASVAVAGPAAAVPAPAAPPPQAPAPNPATAERPRRRAKPEAKGLLHALGLDRVKQHYQQLGEKVWAGAKREADRRSTERARGTMAEIKANTAPPGTAATLSPREERALDSLGAPERGFAPLAQPGDKTWPPAPGPWGPGSTIPEEAPAPVNPYSRKEMVRRILARLTGKE